MELFTNLALGFDVAFSPFTLGLAVIGCILGTMIGSLPGLGPSNGVAILIPLTFSLGLDATQALVLMTSVYYGAMYGGRISSILLNIPGDEPAMMTCLDGYPMARKGRAGDALVLSGVASFVGALLATIGLMLLAPLLARVAYQFGPAEYFALYMLAFTTLGGIGSNNQAKAALAVCLGLGIATIGVVSNSDHQLLVSGKAGRSRWLGRRPRTRPVAMNPVDHPMGGGEGRASGGHPRSRNGIPAKGFRTRNKNKASNKFIIERRKK